ncbi:coenzyme F420-reducing hydrogenase delta subunit [Methanotorris formicicus Mc-S-70]|uniref:Coenzyme F420-reducing hydrogenase delta subunit n=2 Tax=Methanotorris formicicus TaxID=213185 RepID=H1KY22_9EURY|nr:coenzyme F420-reducing hydrogenase delta subunit [Methanotorris formicicus Mc-S-70]
MRNSFNGDKMLPKSLQKEILVFGCGNLLFADDGFGYEVISRLEKMDLPENVELIDAGTGAPYYLMSILDEEAKVKKIIVVDVIDFGLKPGTLKKVDVDELPNINKYTFDAHGTPLAPYLIDVSKKGIDVVIIGCQAKEITMPEIKIGLSEDVKNAVDKAVEMVLEEIYKSINSK